MSQNQQVTKRLSEDDWNILFPGEEFVIGSTVLTIQPLSLQNLNTVTRKLIFLRHKFVEFGGFDGTDEQLATLAQLVISELPELLEVMSGLNKEDIRKLPLDISVDLFTTCLSVNINDQRDLMGKVLTLSTVLRNFMAGGQMTDETEAS